MTTVSPSPAPPASSMALVLDYLASQKLPDNRAEISVDFNHPSMKSVIKAMEVLVPHYCCPCECLVADARFDMEIQHHDGLFGQMIGPAGTAYATGLAHQADGYNNMGALVAPNLPPPIRTLLLTKVKTLTLPRVLQLWGAAQEGVGRAMTDMWEFGWFPKGYHRTHVLVVGVFVHPFAGLKMVKDQKIDYKAFLEGLDMEKSMHAIYGLNYLATIGLVADALTGGLTPEERVERAKKTRHPFRGFDASKTYESVAS